MQSILITATGGPAGNAAVITLKNNYNIIATDMDKYSPALHYKGVTPEITPSANESSYMTYIVELCKKHNVEMVLPCSDEEIITMSKEHQTFNSNNIKLPIPKYEQIIKVSDKYNIQKLAEKAGLYAPKTVEIRTQKDVENKIKEFVFPCVLKPRFSRGARGIIYCNSKHELVYHYNQLRSAFNNQFTIQEYIPGGQGSVLVNQTMWDKKSQLVSSAVLRKLKEKPATGGVAVAGKTEYNEEIRNMTKHLFKEIGKWIGPAGIEYKIHEETGDPYLMEVNPRLQGVTLGFYPYLDFPKMWIEIGFKDTVEKQMNYPDELIFIRTWEDKIYTKKELFFHNNEVP